MRAAASTLLKPTINLVTGVILELLLCDEKNEIRLDQVNGGTVVHAKVWRRLLSRVTCLRLSLVARFSLGPGRLNILLSFARLNKTS